MKCPQCVAEGLTSTLRPKSMTSTLTYVSPFYAEDGSYHYHDGTKRRTFYDCSNGHKFDVLSVDSCLCGWPDTGPYAEVKVANK